MKTKTLMALLLCGAGLILIPAANAQAEVPANNDAVAPPPPPRGPKPNLTEMLTRSLTLNDGQRAQVQSMVDVVKPQLEAIRRQAREEESALIQTLNDQIRPLLTAEQQTKLDALEAERAQRPPGPPPR